MPIRKTTKAAKVLTAKLPAIPTELIEQLAQGPMTAEAIQQASMAFEEGAH